MTEWHELGRGLVAGMLEQQVQARGSMVRWVGIGLIVVGVLLAIAFGGFMRGLGITGALIGLIIVLLVGLIKTMALAAIRRFAVPQSIAEKREEIDRAMERADLPTGPLAVIRFLFRLRKGVGTEVDRLEAIVEDLRVEMVATEPALDQPSVDDPYLDAPDDRPELSP